MKIEHHCVFFSGLRPLGASIRLGDLIEARAEMLNKRNGRRTPKAMSSEVIRPGVRS